MHNTDQLTIMERLTLKVKILMEKELTHPIHCIYFKTIFIEFLSKVIVSTTGTKITRTLLNDHHYHH